MNAGPRQTDADADRAGRLADVLEDVIDRRARGESVSDKSIVSAHADLMPQLAEQLQTLKRVEQARRRAHPENPVGTCLSDDDLESFRVGAGDAQHRASWKTHLKECDSCAARLARRQSGLTDEIAPTPADESTGGTLRSGTRLGDFEIDVRLGAGGMGVVYRARQISLNRRVALKVLPPGLGMTSSAVVRFHREAQASAKLHHANIVAVYAEGEDSGTCFYAMELIEGQGLDQIIAGLRNPDRPVASSSAPTVTFGAPAPPRAEPPPSSTRSGSGLSRTGSTTEDFDTIARWVADVADALDYAHGEGVIHRDIKPSNLMLGDDGRVKVMDFGLARMLEEPGMTMTGEFLGTPRYMSPEQITAGRAKLDHRTDIYSLGATLYELLTLHPPFPGEHRDELIAAIMTKEPQRPRQIIKRLPVDLETICLKAIERDPDRRYAHAGEMARDLRRYVDRETIGAKPTGLTGRLAKFVRRQRVPVATTAAGVVAAVLIAGALAWKLWPEKAGLFPRI